MMETKALDELDYKIHATKILFGEFVDRPTWETVDAAVSRISAQLDSAVAFHEGDRSSHAQLEQELASLKTENSDLQREYTWEAHLRENSETSYSAVYNINQELRAENDALKSELERMRAVVDAAKKVRANLPQYKPGAPAVSDFGRLVRCIEAYLAAHPEMKP